MISVSVQPDNRVFNAEPTLNGIKIIDLLDKKGTSIVFGCRDGNCGSCMVEILDGAENLNTKTSKEEKILKALHAEPHHRLACQCLAKGSVTLKAVEFD